MPRVRPVDYERAMSFSRRLPPPVDGRDCGLTSERAYCSMHARHDEC